MLSLATSALLEQQSEESTLAVEAWNSELATVAARIAPLFARSEPRRRALAYLEGLLKPIEGSDEQVVMTVSGIYKRYTSS